MTNAQDTRFLQFCIQYASIALVFYDYSLTWTREVEYFWKKKFTLSTALYIACRYSLISNVLYLIALAGKLPESLRLVGTLYSSTHAHLNALCSCNSGYQICCSLSVAGRAAVVCILGARTYAIFNKSKCILFVFGSLGATIIIMDSVHVHWVVCANTPNVLGNKSGEPLGFSILFALLVVVYEALAAALTCYRGWQALRIRVDLKTNEKRLDYLVVKEGLLYFSFVSLFTFSALIMVVFAPNGSFLQRLLNALTLPISGMMAARFLMHLREWEHQMTRMSSEPSLESLDFRVPSDHNDTPSEPDASSPTILSALDEFGRCPIREARRYRKTIPDEEV